MDLETEFHLDVFLISDVHRDHDFPNRNLERWLLVGSKWKLKLWLLPQNSDLGRCLLTVLAPQRAV